MHLRYALNSADPKAQSYFKGLESQAVSIRNKRIKVNAEHQITGVSFISVPTTDRTYGYGLKATALIVNSQLINFVLDPMNPQNQTTVMNKDGSIPDVDDQFRKYDETSYYNVSSIDLSHMLKAGAYDAPDYFEHKLNDKLDGLTYQRKTPLHLSQLTILSRNGVRSTNLSEQQADKKLTVTMVDSGLHIARMDGRSKNNPVPNHLDYWLTKALEDIKDEYKQEDDGYRVDQALTDDYLDVAKQSESAAAAEFSRLGIDTTIDGESVSQAQSSSTNLHRAHVRNRQRFIGAVNTESSGDKNINTAKTQVSNELPLSGSSNVFAKRQASLNSLYSSEGAATLSPKATSTGDTELNLHSPVTNGHIPLKQSNSSDSSSNSGSSSKKATSKMDMAEVRRRHRQAHAAQDFER